VSGLPDVDEIAVRWAVVDRPPADVLACWQAVLDPAEQARATRFVFPADRLSYVAAHALLRGFLAELSGLAAHDLRFVTGPFGKPEIAPELDLGMTFSLSHTRSLVAAAVTGGRRIGIDVEDQRRRDVGVALAEHYFSPDEVRLVHATPAPLRHQVILRLWTLKEAYLKATGVGLGRPLDSFSFGLDPITIAFRGGADDDSRSWRFWQQRLTPHHLAAVAARFPPDAAPRITVCEVPARELGWPRGWGRIARRRTP
jgi:4'-phosphopantetheinyl transferase